MLSTSIVELMISRLDDIKRSTAWFTAGETVSVAKKVCSSGDLGKYSAMASMSSRKPISNIVSASSMMSCGRVKLRMTYLKKARTFWTVLNPSTISGSLYSRSRRRPGVETTISRRPSIQSLICCFLLIPPTSSLTSNPL